jgi:hypothetical protein
MFAGRNLIIATKHKKEQVIAPILEKAFGVNCIVPIEFDTDQLGTFSGEKERMDDPITTVRKKCKIAMESFHCDLGIASEGSFIPHPTLYFVPADDEFLIFIDKKNELEIIVRELSTNTNFNSAEVTSEEELLEFCTKVKFPTHGVILKDENIGFSVCEKGITEKEILLRTFHRILEYRGKVFVETDMRAMFNPTRMSVIENATHKLVNKINSRCPACNAPGFSIAEAKPGLPCRLCNTPTRSTLSLVYKCLKCSFVKTEMHPSGKLTEDPMYCDKCNP